MANMREFVQAVLVEGGISEASRSLIGDIMSADEFDADVYVRVNEDDSPEVSEVVHDDDATLPGWHITLNV